MASPRFTALSRRRVGPALGTALAAVLALTGRHDVDAKKRKNKRCRRLGRGCGGKRKCCGSLDCEPIDGLAGKHCCHQAGESCATDDQCCGFLFCTMGGTCDVPDSDRDLKANFTSVDPADMLARVRDLPITTWNYTADDPAVRHIGPMAQDFAALFGAGADDRHIHPLDGQGVALAAIQGLIALVDDLRAENARLAERIAALERG